MARNTTSRHHTEDHDGETIIPLLRLPRKPMVVSAGVVLGKDAASAAGVVPPFDGLPWGLWQARTTLLAGLCKVTTAWHMAMVLYAAVPSPFGTFQCEDRINISVSNGSYSRTLSLPTMETFWEWTWDPWVPYCEDGDGKLLDFDTASALPPSPSCAWWYSIPTVNQWPGGCYRQFMGGFSQLCYLVGIAVGGAICLTLLRRCSPRRILLVALGCEAVLAFVLSVAQVFWAHVLVRFFLAVSSVHVFTSAATLSADVCKGTAKLLTSSLFEIWWSLGIISISVFGSYALNWTCLQAIVSVPSFLLIVPCAVWLPESPRWLVSRGRVEEAADVWERAATLNGQPDLVPPRAGLTVRLSQEATAAHSRRKSECSVWACRGETGAPRCRQVAKLLAVHTAFGCITNTFFGSILNVRNWGTPGMLGLSVGEAAAGVTGIVGIILGTAISTRSSRPWLWIGAVLVVGGSTGLCSHFVPLAVDKGVPRAVQLTLLALSERLAVSAAMPTLSNCAPQLVPPTHRPSLVFSCLLFGRVCLFAAPFVGNLAVYGEAFPLTAFGLQLVLAGVCALFLASIQDNDTARQKELTNKARY